MFTVNVKSPTHKMVDNKIIVNRMHSHILRRTRSIKHTCGDIHNTLTDNFLHLHCRYATTHVAHRVAQGEN